MKDSPQEKSKTLFSHWRTDSNSPGCQSILIKLLWCFKQSISNLEWHKPERLLVSHYGSCFQSDLHNISLSLELCFKGPWIWEGMSAEMSRGGSLAASYVRRVNAPRDAAQITRSSRPSPNRREENVCLFNACGSYRNHVVFRESWGAPPRPSDSWCLIKQSLVCGVIKHQAVKTTPNMLLRSSDVSVKERGESRAWNTGSRCLSWVMKSRLSQKKVSDK